MKYLCWIKGGSRDFGKWIEAGKPSRAAEIYAEQDFNSGNYEIERFVIVAEGEEETETEYSVMIETIPLFHAEKVK